MNIKNTLILIMVVTFVVGTAIFIDNAQNTKVPQKQTGVYSSDISNVALAKSPEIVSLKNGDSYDLTASVVKKQLNGKEVRVLAYNGSIPGPIITVPQGAEITVNFKNDTDVDSTIHSHGVRLDNKFDGVVGVTQKVVKIGDSFTYKLKFPDPGAYWYHPHFRDDYGQEMGLYGNYIVVPTDKDYYSLVNKELVLFLDDILLKNGNIAPFNKGLSNHTLMGRFGNTMFLNGETNYSQTVNKGDVVRFYLTNAANARIFNFSIPGAKMKLVGSDNGKYEKETFVDTIMISNSERAIVEVLFDQPGSYTIESKTPDNTYALGTVTVSDTLTDTSYAVQFNTLRTNQDVIASIDPHRFLFNKPADKSLTLTLSMMGRGSMMQGNETATDNNPEKIEWENTVGMMNAMSNSEMVKWKLVDQATKKENMDIDWQFKKGDKVKIKIFNDPKSQHPMQHPIHVHGQKFLVLSTNSVPTQDLVWKDTVLVQTGDTVEILTAMENPGDWMIHCHIPEHIESGMMLGFKIS